MNIAVLIPDRGDRPLFLKNCLRMLKTQTIQPNTILVVDEKPKSDDKDITYRYRIGYDALRNKGIDIIFLMENDDWYAEEYIETMLNYWEEKGRPNLLGLNHTIYYNINWRIYYTMHHTVRSSAMNTLIKPDLNFEWCVDNYAYTDIWLWNTISNWAIINPEKEICLGIKHGVGLCGGVAHVDARERYENEDPNFEFLKKTIDQESFNFYSKYFNK